MKKITLLHAVLFLSVLGFGQSREGTVSYEKMAQPAAVIELPYPPSVVDAAMDDYLLKKGRSKSNQIKGFSTFRNTQAVPADSVNADLYFKTERKSRKEKNITVVSLLVMSDAMRAGADNLHYLNMEEARTYLNALASAVEAYGLERTIKEQNETVIKAEAKYRALVSKGEDLEQKRAVLDREIAANKDDQAMQLKEIESQKKKLTGRIGERKF